MTTDATTPVGVRRTPRHHFIDIGGQQIFYGEAGHPDDPTIVLLHGAPASSYMFRDLTPCPVHERSRRSFRRAERCTSGGRANDADGFAERVTTAVADVAAAQVREGLDVVTDGEMGRSAS